MTDKTTAELEADLHAAEEDYENFRQQASFARNRECDAMNKLNAAQKALAARFETLRKKALRDSDWARERNN